MCLHHRTISGSPLLRLLVSCISAAVLFSIDASAFGLLEKIGSGRVAAQHSSLSSYIRGRYARTVITDTFPAFAWPRCLYGVCVPTYAIVTNVRVKAGGNWKNLRIGSNSAMWSPGRETNKDYQLELFGWLQEKRRDYCIFEFSTSIMNGPVLVETTYEEVIPMFGNKWAYRIPFGWNVGGGTTPVDTWTIDVEVDENFSQPRLTPVLPGISVQGRVLRGTVSEALSAPMEPIIECVEHPEHRNTTVRDEFGSQHHIGMFLTPVLSTAPSKPRTISIILPPGITNSSGGLPQARLFFDALLSRVSSYDYVNVWSNSKPVQSLWKKPQRAHDDNVFAILNLLDNQVNLTALPMVDVVFDSVMRYDATDSTQHEIVVISQGGDNVSTTVLQRVPSSTPVSVVTMSNDLPKSTLQPEYLRRGGTYQHVAWWYGWRSKIPAVADSCLGIPLTSVAETISNSFSPEPPVYTLLMNGARKVVYAYDDGRPATQLRDDFKGLVARTWANARVNRLVNTIIEGVSPEVKLELVSEIRNIGTMYQIWTAYNPFVE